MKEKILNFIENNQPFKKSKKTSIYEFDDFIIKVFFYKNLLLKFFLLKGLRSYIFSKILKKKGINVPDAKFYFSKKNIEIFVYKKVKGEELLKALEREKSDILIQALIDFVKQLFNKKVYHKDFDPTNIILSEEKSLYLIDLENISLILTKKRKIKMVNKLNKFFKKNLNLSIDFFNII